MKQAKPAPNRSKQPQKRFIRGNLDRKYFLPRRARVRARAEVAVFIKRWGSAGGESPPLCPPQARNLFEGTHFLDDFMRFAPGILTAAGLATRGVAPIEPRPHATRTARCALAPTKLRQKATFDFSAFSTALRSPVSLAPASGGGLPAGGEQGKKWVCTGTHAAPGGQAGARHAPTPSERALCSGTRAAEST